MENGRVGVVRTRHIGLLLQPPTRRARHGRMRTCDLSCLFPRALLQLLLLLRQLLLHLLHLVLLLPLRVAALVATSLIKLRNLLVHLGICRARARPLTPMQIPKRTPNPQAGAGTNTTPRQGGWLGRCGLLSDADRLRLRLRHWGRHGLLGLPLPLRLRLAGEERKRSPGRPHPRRSRLRDRLRHGLGDGGRHCRRENSRGDWLLRLLLVLNLLWWMRWCLLQLGGLLWWGLRRLLRRLLHLHSLRNHDGCWLRGRGMSLWRCLGER